VKSLDHTTWLREGRQFLRVAQRAYQTRSKLTPEILYNVLGLAVEKCLMATLDVHGRLPDNHTFTDLVEATRQVMELDPDLSRELIELEGFQEICCLETYQRKPVGWDTIGAFLPLAEQVEILAAAQCGAARTV
jgi:HEPN domain-containing protein